MSRFQGKHTQRRVNVLPTFQAELVPGTVRTLKAIRARVIGFEALVGLDTQEFMAAAAATANSRSVVVPVCVTL